MRRRDNEVGSAVVWVMLAIAAAASLTVAQWTAATADEAVRTGPQRPAERLADARDRIVDWYAGGLAVLDAPDTAPPDAPDVFAATGLAGDGGLRFAASGLLRDGEIGWRVLLLWITPGAGDTTRIDDTGAVQLDARVRDAVTFSSQPLQRAAWAASEATLRRLAGLAERRFEARIDADAMHEVTVNHFRDADGACRLDADSLPCTDQLAPTGWAGVATLAARSHAFGAAGSAALPTVNAWGLPLLASNDADPAWRRPPFAMAFSTITPWGTAITVRAVQPR